MEAVFLEGKNVILKLPSIDDLPLMLKWVNDKEIKYYVANILPVSEKSEKEWLEEMNNNPTENIVLLICFKSKERQIPIGVMGLHKIDLINRNAETGALIGEKEYWGQGLGTEAKMLLLDYAFNRLNLFKVYSGAIKENPRSIAHQKKTGAVIEGVRKKHKLMEGKYHDLVLLAIFANKWRKLWEKDKGKYLP